MTISVQNEADYSINESRLLAAAQTVLAQHEDVSDAELTIVITDDAAVQQLNQQFRHVDAPTDILSFPAETPDIDLPEAAQYLGDLIVAYPYAAAQAEREGHALHDSLDLLIVHGTLHLLGYDHDTLENRAEMWAKQATCLEKLGISTDIVPALEEAAHDD
jgi:probable rRNA maturation factor